MKVYRYGLLPPTEAAEIVERSLRIAHDYRNQLVELERDRRRRMRELDTLATEALRRCVEKCRADVEAAVAEMRREKSRTRKRSTPTAMREAVKDAKAALKIANKDWRDAMTIARADTATQERRDEINEWWLAERRRLRPGRTSRPDGVDAGTYQLVEDADAKGRADLPLWDGDLPADPRFRRWTGDGAISVQIVGGVSVRAMLDGESRQVQVAESARADRRDPSSRRSQLRKRVDLLLRVGSTEDRSPVWARFPMVLHRPLPDGGAIKRVTVLRRMIGPRVEWCAQFVVNEPGGAISCGDGAVGIDIGWRQLERGVRIAFTSDGDEILLPPDVAGGLAKVSDLRSIRDKNFEAAKAELARWLSECDQSLDQWIGDATEHLHQWRSQGRLAALVIRWRNERFAGDEDVFARMESWRKQDRHLWLWETSQRTSSLRRRKDFYRNVAALLARRYGTCVLEKFDLGEIAKREPDREKRENESARSMRFVVAPSEFRECLRNAFASRGGGVVEVPAEHTSTTCAECGERVEFDAATMLRAECSNGHEWDQDANAAVNIRARWSGEPDPATARSDDAPTESRQERVRRMRAEKVERMGRSKLQSDGSATQEVA